MSSWSDRRLRWVGAATGVLFVVPPALLSDGSVDTWLSLFMLASVPFLFAVAPAWAFMLKRDKTEDDRLRMVAGITSWPSRIAMALAFLIMGLAVGLKIAGTTGAIIGALLAGALEGVGLGGQRRLHHRMEARLRGEAIEPTQRSSVGRIAIGILTIVGSLCVTAALGYALGGSNGAVALGILGVLYLGAMFAFSHHRRRKIRAQESGNSE